MSEPHRPPLPPRLVRAALDFSAEEATTRHRHELLGKIGASRMLATALGRRVLATPALADDARTREMIDLLDATLAGALTMLERRSGGASALDHDPADLVEVATEIVGAAEEAQSIRLVAPEPVWVDARGDDLAIAIACLVDNALDAARTLVEVRVFAVGTAAHVEVIDDGNGPPAELNEPHFVSTRPERLGLGLRVAHRIARAWQGSIELERRGDLTVAALVLPSIRGAGAEGG